MVEGGARERLIVALDFPSRREAFQMVDRLNGVCRWFKVGMELFFSQDGVGGRRGVAHGGGLVEELRARGCEVFLDLKLHDIPNTVARAVRSLEGAGASLLTVHAAGGAAMMAAARSAVQGRMKLLAVTVLTSLDAEQLRDVGVEAGPLEQVLRLGQLAEGAGMDGMVCSAEEVGALRGELGAGPLLVVPGIRSAEDAAGDQRRVATAAEAIRRGASMLVVGRPITRAADPVAAAQRVLEQMEATMAERSLGARLDRPER